MAALLAAALLGAGWLTPGPARAESLPTASALIAQMKSREPGLKDYAAKMKIKVNATYQVSVSFKLKGDYFYRSPGEVKIKLRNVPGYMSKYQQAFNGSYEILTKPQDFNLKVEGVETVDGDSCYKVSAMPKHPAGELVNETYWISTSNKNIIRFQAAYKNNGSIDLHRRYGQVNNFWIAQEDTGTFNFPAIRLTADLSTQYDGFHTNANLPDSIFASED